MINHKFIYWVSPGAHHLLVSLNKLSHFAWNQLLLHTLNGWRALHTSRIPFVAKFYNVTSIFTNLRHLSRVLCTLLHSPQVLATIVVDCTPYGYWDILPASSDYFGV